MSRTLISLSVGGLLAVGLLVAALWGWQNAAEVAEALGASRPNVAALAVRSGAVALGAAGQVALLTLVVGPLYRRQLLDEALRLTLGLVTLLGLVSAVALGLAGR